MRLDVPFHRPSLVRYIQRIDAHPAGIEPIRNLAIKVVDGPFGTQLKADEYVDSGIPLIRVSDVRTGKISRDGLVYITPEKQDALCRSRVLPNDVVLTKAGAILGYAAVFPDSLVEGNITSHSVLIRCQDRILPQFLAYFLRSAPGQRQVYRWGNKATRPELNTQEVKRIHVPLLGIDEQREIIAIMREGECRSEKLLADAKRLLSSIDDYLLAELGITLPPEPENTIANRIFTAQRRNLAGERFDPFYNNQTNISLQKSLEAIHAVPFRSLIRVVTKGETPLWRGDEYQEEGIPFLRAQNVTPDGLAGDLLKIDDSVDQRMKRSQLFGGEILYTMAGSIGIACVYPSEHGRANINQAIAKIALNTEDDTLKTYIKEILNSSICRRQAERALTVSAQPNINFGQIKSILIPIPSNKIKLDTIVERCGVVRDSVKQLRQKAQAELEAAKRRIEAMLLGEDA